MVSVTTADVCVASPFPYFPTPLNPFCASETRITPFCTALHCDRTLSAPERKRNNSEYYYTHTILAVDSLFYHYIYIKLVTHTSFKQY